MVSLINPFKVLVIIAKIKGIRIKILIDFECLGNFISPDFVKKA